MKSSLLLLMFLLANMVSAIGQPSGVATASNEKVIKKDSLTDEAKDSILQSKMTYPLLHSSKAAGVLPAPGVDEFQDSTIQYKLLFGLFPFSKGTPQKLNDNLSETARSINLHVAAGIPRSHLNLVVIVYGPAINLILNNAVYKERYHTDNPNIALIQEMQKNGVKFIACAQSMYHFDITRDAILPGIKETIGARPAMSYYQMMGYHF